MDREQAIAQLRTHGFTVSERQWALGDTILVAVRPHDAGGIRVYGTAEYLHPQDDQRWGLTDFTHNGPGRSFSSLEEAVEAITVVMLAAVNDAENR